MTNRDRTGVLSACISPMGGVIFAAGLFIWLAVDGSTIAVPKEGLEPMQYSAEPNPEIDRSASFNQPITIDGVPLTPDQGTRTLVAADGSDVAAQPAIDAVDVSELMERIRELERLVAGCGDSAYAQAFRSGELDRATKEEQEAVRVILEYAPIQLMPGEALWLIERVRFQDWQSWGCMESALVRFFGEPRVRAAVGDKRFGESFADE